ncbi:MAG: sulfatase-like hydrolase/transferase [Planctomycetes bacterium]|nr:sulfatase-like hydrolase/transferase [Planctomycetota bacterium]
MKTAFAISALLLACQGTLPAERPNILIITADNLGYGDLRCYNPNSRILSPNLDRLAADGVRLTDFYTASPTCTVSRACLLTGRIADRHGLKNQLPGIEGNYGIGLSHDEILIPQVLKTAGYPTGCFGKWNIGFAKGSRPTERGFDEFLGHASGNIDYYHHVYNGKHDLFKGTESYHADGQYSTDLFADAAIEFIERRSKTNQPWFCYLPFNAPHFPNAKNKKPGQPNVWQASNGSFAAYGTSPDETDPHKRYAAVITALDEAIGRVLAALDHAGATDKPIAGLIKDLKRRGLLEETLVVWSGEFGRSPWSQDLSGTSPIEKHGREHQQESFCTWMAGGGVKAGFAHGVTDDFGHHPVEGKVHLYDLQATILHLLGLDHERLTYRHAGRDFRLTDVYGNVVKEILA